MSKSRSAIKTILKGVAWLAAALLALGAAWFLCNNRWVDAPASEVPLALRPPLPALPRAQNGFYALVELNQPGADQRLEWPGGGAEPATVWNCNSEQGDCVDRWRAHAQALTLLAQQRGDVATMRSHLQAGEALAAGLLRGSRSLLGSVIAWRIAEEHWQTVVALAAVQPELAPAMAAFIPALPAEAVDPARWMVSEAWFGRQIGRELSLGCELAEPRDLSAAQQPMTCSPSPIYMPNATQQLFDAHWLQALAMARGGPLALLDWAPEPQGLRLFAYAWRNTIGQILFDVAMPAWTGYAGRQANLLLQQHAATLALQAAAVTPTQRPAWLAQQPIDARLRQRLRLDGSHIVARTWPKDASSPHEIRFPIPSMQDT